MDAHPGLGAADHFRPFWRGHLWRHDTEPQWNELFEVLGLEPQYEPVGFKIGCLRLGGYRPDFYLGAVNAWAEIKAGRPDDEAFAKAKALCRATGKAVVIFSGAPSDRPACWLYRPSDLCHAGPLVLASWLPLDGLAFTCQRGSLIIRLDGDVTTVPGLGRAIQSEHMRAAVAAALAIPLMPADRASVLA
jgi:hypothetical protein